MGKGITDEARSFKQVGFVPINFQFPVLRAHYPTSLSRSPSPISRSKFGNVQSKYSALFWNDFKPFYGNRLDYWNQNSPIELAAQFQIRNADWLTIDTRECSSASSRDCWQRGVPGLTCVRSIKSHCKSFSNKQAVCCYKNVKKNSQRQEAPQ